MRTKVRAQRTETKRSSGCWSRGLKSAKTRPNKEPQVEPDTDTDSEDSIDVERYGPISAQEAQRAATAGTPPHRYVPLFPPRPRGSSYFSWAYPSTPCGMSPTLLGRGLKYLLQCGFRRSALTRCSARTARGKTASPYGPSLTAHPQRLLLDPAARSRVRSPDPPHRYFSMDDILLEGGLACRFALWFRIMKS